MLCKICMNVMETGITYEQNKERKSSAKRFYECKKCHDKIYTKELNFHKFLSKASERCRNK